MAKSSEITLPSTPSFVSGNPQGKVRGKCHELQSRCPKRHRECLYCAHFLAEAERVTLVYSVYRANRYSRVHQDSAATVSWRGMRTI